MRISKLIFLLFIILILIFLSINIYKNVERIDLAKKSATYYAQEEYNQPFSAVKITYNNNTQKYVVVVMSKNNNTTMLAYEITPFKNKEGYYNATKVAELNPGPQ
ncbi:MAG: hypothetical protein Q8873_04555 [Bacillota bacterium]|nr:hypothetical protein [Bacillota bacterium]